MTSLQAIILGALQGFSELFPISSLGHSVLLPPLLRWNIDQRSESFLIFLVATHCATALVLFGFFWRDWLRIFSGLWRSLRNREISATDPDEKLGWLLVVATVPAGVLGILYEERFKQLFANPRAVSMFLLLNGVMLFGAEYLRKRAGDVSLQADSDKRIAKLSWCNAIKIGAFQCLALLPGFSRTGSTITGGLLSDLSHEDAARFSFLLATPIIAAASVLKIPELALGANRAALGVSALGAACAAIAAYVTVKFLSKYFKKNTLRPFATYCLCAGIFLTWFFSRS